MGFKDFQEQLRTGLKIKTIDGKVTLTGYTKKADVPGTLCIPDTVQVIGDSALSDTKNITKIIIPDSVKRIGEHVFANSEALEEVILPDMLDGMSDTVGMFWACKKLRTVRLPACMDSIPTSFMGFCSELEEITIPEGVTTIDSGAFDNCERLRTVHLPATLKEIFIRAFCGCTSLEAISLPEGLECIEMQAFAECPNLIRPEIPAGCEVDETAFG